MKINTEMIIKTVKHPNFWTLFRILAVPGIVILMYSTSKFATVTTAIIFSVAAITDFVDGYLARSQNLVTNLGKILDPLADKLLVASSLIMLTMHGWVPAWMVCIIIGRELAVTGLRNLISEDGGDVSASWLGKLKTGFQIAAIIPLMVHHTIFGLDFNAVGQVLIWFALASTIWSGMDYFIKARKLFFS